MACGPFDSDLELKAVFSDARISTWQHNLPQVNNPDNRVKAVIQFLFDSSNAAHENALVLFLQVLGESTDPSNSCHKRLLELAHGLKVECFTNKQDG